MNDLSLLHAARRRPPHRHRGPIQILADTAIYAGCGHLFDAERARRAKNNAKRGKKLQKKRIEGLGGTNLLGNNENLDGRSELFAFEHKSTKRFPGVWWGYLKGIPHTSGQVQVLVVTEAPGPGRRARSVVVIDYDDWRDLHGPAGEVA